MKKFLIIQTAFIGDVILGTPIIEKLHESFPYAKIDFLLRKGNEGLLTGHPYIDTLYIWDKKNGKYYQLLLLLKTIRKIKYDYIINLQRFLSTGLFTVFSKSTITIGFDKNPMSWFFTQRFPHIMDLKNKEIHEVDRNLMLITRLVKVEKRILPRLYPCAEDFDKVKESNPYLTISPTSVWYTKQYPLNKWVDVINLCNPMMKIFLLGGKNDEKPCQWIKDQTIHPNVIVMAGKLSFLESAALMKNARMNFVNDSAPLHLASAMNAPVKAIFCSTVPSFGFGPLSTQSKTIETSEILDCRPCGNHGYKRCPKVHFKCAEIPAENIICKESVIIK